MLHTIIKGLKICIDINEISKVDHYMRIFTSRIFRLVLGISIYLCIFSYKWLTSYSHKIENLISGVVLIRAAGGGGGGVEVGNFFEKN